MIRVRFIKDWILPLNGKTVSEGTVIVLDSELAGRLISEGYCVAHGNKNAIPDELNKALQEAAKPKRRNEGGKKKKATDN